MANNLQLEEIGEDALPGSEIPGEGLVSLDITNNKLRLDGTYFFSWSVNIHNHNKTKTKLCILKEILDENSFYIRSVHILKYRKIFFVLLSYLSPNMTSWSA